MPSTNVFQLTRFEHENEVRRKALKPEKKWNPTLFGIQNPLCWNPESTAWNPESKTVLDSLTWGENFERLLVTDFCSNDFSEIPLAYLLYQLKPIPEISVKNISKIFY